ncbi:MAG: metallophosphoesterase family protein [Thermaerobacter sp.]|nr:metallophosphoesterase family protein [Thermaerobacter sp.]
MTRVLVTADTHAPRRRLPDWLVRLAARADLIVHAGDVCDAATLQTLGALAPLYAVRGNNDFDLPLPSRLLLTLEGVRLGIVHGDTGPGQTTAERAWRSFPERPEIVVFGHSHGRLWESHDGVTLLNPGSPTKPRGDAPSACWLTLSRGEHDIRFVGEESAQ